MKSFSIPRKSYLQKGFKLLFESEIKLGEKSYDYYHLNEKIYDCEDFPKLLQLNGVNKIVKISSGTSDRKAYKGYITQSIADLKNNTYYRNYSSPKGNKLARRALAIMETYKLGNSEYFTLDDICLTSGSTGAITLVFEYLKNDFPDKEILIATPAYYVYKFAAKYWQLSFKEIFPIKRTTFKCIDELINNISDKTKLIVLTQPSNPSGEVYTPEELRRLLTIAKRKDILILVDELFFDLIFKAKNYFGTTTTASSIDALENLAIIRGYSKNKNLAAFRLGYLLSKNKKLMDFAEKSSEVRQCFPVASNNTGLIGLDAFIQSVGYLSGDKPSLKLITKLKKEFNFIESINSKTDKQLLSIYKNYKKYSKKILDFYSTNYDIAMEILKGEIEIATPKEAAFNTFVKIKELDNINFFDFCFNFYLTCGVETQIGPCYAFDQKIWQRDPKLGFWLRISFARNRKQFIYGLRKFIEFKKLYLNNKNKFLETNLCF